MSANTPTGLVISAKLLAVEDVNKFSNPLHSNTNKHIRLGKDTWVGAKFVKPEQPVISKVSRFLRNGSIIVLSNPMVSNSERDSKLNSLGCDRSLVECTLGLVKQKILKELSLTTRFSILGNCCRNP
ncbi:hypothetical protein VNO78_33105 [Psophocarpus tetragonolobus]|uniref:Uncharacterized protein n=1 Tax=Psophocarpus tetragonolobus TaxID=3891 RepID=A0AAN9NXR5_PSOTE